MAAVAPGLNGQRPRQTRVLRRPYWMEWGNDGAGRVKLLPADRAHNTMIIDADGVQTPYYQSKGYVPLNLLPADHKAHGVFREMCAAAVARAKKDRLPAPDWVPPSLAGAGRERAQSR